MWWARQGRAPQRTFGTASAHPSKFTNSAASRSFRSESNRKGKENTHLSVKTTHVRVRDDLGDDAAEGVDAKLGRAVAVEPKVVAEADRERGPLLGRGEREELADLERGLAPLAVVRAEHGVARD